MAMSKKKRKRISVKKVLVYSSKGKIQTNESTENKGKKPIVNN